MFFPDLRAGLKTFVVPNISHNQRSMEPESGICQPPNSAKTVKTASPSLADKAPAVLQTFFSEFPNRFLSQHHTESYEAFVFRELPEIIHSENPLTILKEPIDAKAGIYAYKVEIYIGGNVPSARELAIDIGAPTVALDNGKTVRRMFPNEAQIRDLTYAATFQADILIRVTFTNHDKTQRVKELLFEKFQLFKLPILLRSKLCATHNASQALLAEMGECRNDQGGYFIIDGSEKVLITRQEQAFNSVNVTLKAPTDLDISTYASVICQHPLTKQTRRITLYRLHEQRMLIDKKKDAISIFPVTKYAGEIRVSIPFVKGTIPLFVLFRALGIESDKDIVRMILPDTDAPMTRAMETSLIASIHDGWNITTTVHAIEFIKTLTSGFIVEHVLNILHEYLFSHVPDRPFARAQYLAEIVRKMIRVEMGLEPPTNRDDIRNQRLLPTGTLLRGLFSACWKDWKKAVKLTIDEQYNFNRNLYKGEDFLQIFNAGAINKVLNPKNLNDALLRGFRGKWGTNQFNMKQGVIQPLGRLSYLDAMSHVRRVISDFDTSLKLVGPRHLNPSQIGYFCTAETPSGGKIGAVKNLSILTAISVATPFLECMNWLQTKGTVKMVSLATSNLSAKATSVQINGGTIGFTEKPDVLTHVLKLMKWTACLPPTASVAFNTGENVLRIYMDDGRPLRPLWHLDDGKWPKQMLKNEPLPSWRDLVCGSLPATKEKGIFSADFVDPFAHREDATLEDYVTLLTPHIGAIEYIDPYEGNEAYISWWGSQGDFNPAHTHAEIHPSSLMGLLGNMIPFSNHNQSPRNQLSCSQSKQGIGYYATNYENRFDVYGSMLCYGEGPICRTILSDAVGGGNMPYGANIIFCLNSFNGYNQDDGIIINRNSVERGLFRSLALRSYVALEEEDPITKAVYQIGNPRNIVAWTDLKPGNDYSKLDENGIIKEGTIITDKTVLVGRFFKDPESGKVGDASVTPTVFTKGSVDKVAVLHQANGLRLVRIRILEERVPELGDKFSSRHGQKGTIGMLMDAQDMPRTADGIVPDVMVNPHCIPSRMTVAQLLEQVFAKFGAVIGAKMNATSFMNDDQSFTAIANALESLGLQRHGEEIVYSGMTGKMFTGSIFMGPLYFMRIKHLVQDKLNARGAGRKEIRTHQPTGGRGNEGGMRIGEMERDVLIAHGVTDFFQESMMKRSDGTSFFVCNGCGTIPIYNESQNLFVCPSCDGPLTFQGDSAETIGLVLPVRKSRATYSRVEMPYAMKLLDQELGTFMNAGFRYLTEANARKFREPTEMDLGELLELKAELEKQEQEEKQEEKQDEDAPEDLADEGQPQRNDTGAPLPKDAQVIEFSSSNPQYKEFNNYFPVKLTLDGKVWPTAEHYFQAMKFTANPEYQETIRLAKTPSQAKKLGKTSEVKEREDWNTHRIDVMKTVIREKFGKNHPELMKKLLDTGSMSLRDGSPMDNFWGIGKKKIGKNMLGLILMEVREELRTPDADMLLTTESVKEVIQEQKQEEQKQEQEQEQKQEQEQEELVNPSRPMLKIIEEVKLEDIPDSDVKIINLEPKK